MDSSFNRRLDGLVVEAGMATSLTRGVLTDHHKTWVPNMWAGHIFRIRGGESANDQVHGVVGGNSTDQLYFETPLADTSESPLESAYEILSLKSVQAVNELDVAILDILNQIALDMRRLVVGMSLTTDQDLDGLDGGVEP